MRHSTLYLRFTLPALSAVVLACGEPTGPTPSTEAGSPSLAAASVRRFTDQFFDAITDPSTGLTALLGISRDQLARACAGEPFTLDDVTIVEVTRPDGSVKVTVHGNDLTVLVFAGIVEDVCELAGEAPLATGRAKVTQTDNDFFVSRNRTNSFGLSLIGRATAAEGGTHYLVRGRFRATISRQLELVIRTLNFSVRPVGR
jgi:hypothetical protein